METLRRSGIGHARRGIEIAVVSTHTVRLNILPSVKFPNFAKVSCFSCFVLFFLEKEEKMGESSSMGTALKYTNVFSPQ